jgi:SAM-dependent methyltransferase
MDERAVRIKQFWEERGKRIEDPTIAARFRADDRLEYDLQLARNFCTPDSRVLDLGAGACGLSYYLAPFVREIVAVDFVQELLEKRALPPNIKTIVSDIRDFEVEDLFDVVLIYGVLNYVLDDDDVARVYRNIHRMLAPDGVCIIKHQSGVHEAVPVDKFSEEFGTRYIAVYRHLDREIELLKSLFDVEVLDVYPAHLNRWANTHFYAYVCRRREVVGAMAVSAPARDADLAA